MRLAQTRLFIPLGDRRNSQTITHKKIDAGDGRPAACITKLVQSAASSTRFAPALAILIPSPEYYVQEGHSLPPGRDNSACLTSTVCVQTRFWQSSQGTTPKPIEAPSPKPLAAIVEHLRLLHLRDSAVPDLDG